MAEQLQELQKENSRLNKRVADLALDMLIVKEAARPNCRASSVAGGRRTSTAGVTRFLSGRGYASPSENGEDCSLTLS